MSRRSSPHKTLRWKSITNYQGFISAGCEEIKYNINADTYRFLLSQQWMFWNCTEFFYMCGCNAIWYTWQLNYSEKKSLIVFNNLCVVIFAFYMNFANKFVSKMFKLIFLKKKHFFNKLSKKTKSHFISLTKLIISIISLISMAKFIFISLTSEY